MKRLIGSIIAFIFLILPIRVSADNFSSLNIVQPTTNTALSVIQNGNTSGSSSVGGAINLNNTNNTGAGLVLYTNQANAISNLLSVRSDNANFNQAAIYGTSQGIGPTLLLVNRSVGTNSPAANIVSTNPNFSALGVSGQELGHGTIKVTHYGTGNDVNSAGVSIDLTGPGTAAQGLYINASQGPTTGKLIFVQNDTTPRFILYADGHTTFSGNIETTNPNGCFVMPDRSHPGTKYCIYIDNGQLMSSAL